MSNGTAIATVAPQNIIPINVGETASSALAAQVVANIQARYALAKKMPRDLDEVRIRLLKECKRPSFAKTAIYHKPIGKGVEGPSIRFAEAALRCMTNCMPETIVVFDDDDKRILKITVTDLEANLSYSEEITIAKRVERHKSDGREVVTQRLNSYGKTVYIIKATDEEILDKQNALVSKALRTIALRLLPGDIKEEAINLCYETMQDEAAKDPDATRKNMVSAFAALGVNPSQLVAYLQHPIDQTTPAEVVKLREIHTAIKDGEATWSEVMGHGEDQAAAAPAPDAKTNKTAEMLKNRRQEVAPEKEAAPAAESKPTQDTSYGPPPMQSEPEPKPTTNKSGKLF
jgi:hypothetical protein